MTDKDNKNERSELLGGVPIHTSPFADLTDIYFFSPASPEELASGNYIEFFGMRVSADNKKHAVIKNVLTGDIEKTPDKN